MENKHNCNECPVRKLLAKFFPTIHKPTEDMTTDDYACGYWEYWEHDDTPGFRSKDHGISTLHCILKDRDVECDPERIKNLCHKVLDYYQADECIGDKDIERFFEDQAPDKYGVHASDEEIKAVHKYMRKLTNVNSGYEYECDPDDIAEDPRWDD